MRINNKRFAIGLMASTLALGCIAYATILSRWTYQPCSVPGYNVERLNQQEALAWVVSVNVLALLFVLSRNAWTPAALGLLGVVAFAVTGPMLVLMAISECGVAGWDLSPFFAAFLGGSTLMAGAAISLVVRVVKFLAVGAFAKSAVVVRGVRFQTSDVLAALAFVAAAASTSLIVAKGLDWAAGVPFDFWASIIVPVAAAAALVATSVALNTSVTRRQR